MTVKVHGPFVFVWERGMGEAESFFFFYWIRGSGGFVDLGFLGVLRDILSVVLSTPPPPPLLILNFATSLHLPAETIFS